MPNTFVKIASVTVGSGGAASIDFTSIPQTYTDLKVMLSSRTTAAAASATAEYPYIVLNNNTSGYSQRQLLGNGSTPSSVTRALGGQGYTYVMPGTANTASTFGSLEVYFPNYVGSDFKSSSADGAPESNVSTLNSMLLDSSLWSNTSAITQITIYPSAGSFAQYTTANLYGIKNS